MGYRIDQNPESGEKELVIDGWEKGIADSPYSGIASMKNVNSSWLPGATYVNYKRIPSTISGGTMGIPKYSTQSTGVGITYYILDDKGQVWSGNGSSWTLITGNHTASSGYGQGIIYWQNYLFVFGPTFIEVCGNGTGPGGITSSNWHSVNSSGYWAKNLLGTDLPNWPNNLTAAPIAPQAKTLTAILPAGGTSATLSSTWSGATAVYQVTFSDGEVRSILLTSGSDAMTWTDKLLNAVSVNIIVGTQSVTLSFPWPYISGNYELRLGGGSPYQYVIGTFTYNSPTVTLGASISITTSSQTIAVNIFPKIANPSLPYEHMALVGYDDVLYFCNGVTLGSILAPTGKFFNPSETAASATFNYNALQLPLTDVANWLALLSNNVLVAGNNAVYPWGAFSNPQPVRYDVPFPMSENVSKMINILNTVYLFAGSKGNIYQTNGYQVTLFKKIPDSFLGTVDPNWVIGGIMYHRNKLCFGAFGGSQSVTPRIVGIFSLMLVSGAFQGTFETSGSLTCESQNSFGFTPTGNCDATNVLIDLNQSVGSTNGRIPDNYVSAWYNSGVGGIDYNDTHLWDNWEPAIETDLIPMGTFLTGATPAQVEFKLDRPMLSGDQIRLSARKSFTDLYTVLGTTTTNVLSDIYPNNSINAGQWIQFKVEFKCGTSSPSSFIPLREIRMHYGY